MVIPQGYQQVLQKSTLSGLPPSVLQESGLTCALLVSGKNSMFKNTHSMKKSMKLRDQLNELFTVTVLCSEHRQMTRVGSHFLAPRDQPEVMQRRGRSRGIPHGKPLWEQVL